MKSVRETIPELANECERDDCRISSQGGTTTLMNWVTEYDKYGFPVSPDPNTVTMTYQCRSCSKRWLIEECAGKRTIKVAA